MSKLYTLHKREWLKSGIYALRIHHCVGYWIQHSFITHTKDIRTQIGTTYKPPVAVDPWAYTGPRSRCTTICCRVRQLELLTCLLTGLKINSKIKLNLKKLIFLEFISSYKIIYEWTIILIYRIMLKLFFPMVGCRR